MAQSRKGIVKFIRDDSMSIALFTLFLICIALQAFSGWLSYDEALRQGRYPEISFGAYLGTGDFLDGIFTNWQAAVLQLAVLIAFSSVLRQKGAAHSRKVNPRTIDWTFAKRPSLRKWLYANSLSLTFFTLFLIAFCLHAVFGWMKHNEDQALRHLPPAAFGNYVFSSSFWSSVFMTWEAEFFAIGLYVVLSIFLRQEGSPESKHVSAGDDDTGETYK